VCSGSLDAVKVLVEAGANTTTNDKVWGLTPLGWADYYISESKSGGESKEYNAIATYLGTRLTS
jgi:peptide-methionine (S)-S-oxide reductase